jgi:hypothetical protein
MDETSKRLDQMKSRETFLSEAYRLQLSRLWWANLMFVAVPAVLSAAAAVVAALKPEHGFAVFNVEVPYASAFAGTAAVLIAVHKALKCDEFQAECLRLGQAYESIAIAAGCALSRPIEERGDQQKRISDKMEGLAESAKAQLWTGIIQKTEKRLAPRREVTASAPQISSITA